MGTGTRRAGRRHQAEPHETPTLDGVRGSFRDVLPLLLASRFDAMGAILPGLLRDADALVALFAGGAQRDARTLRSQVRQVTGSLMPLSKPNHGNA